MTLRLTLGVVQTWKEVYALIGILNWVISVTQRILVELCVVFWHHIWFIAIHKDFMSPIFGVS
jgi:hypothetical protein